MTRTADEWDAAYAATTDGRTLWTAGPNPQLAQVLVEVLAGRPAGSCVDVAAGEGRHAVWLAAQGWDVHAVDFSATGLERAQQAAAASGVAITTVAADVTTWSPEQPVDLVLCAYLHLRSATLRPLLTRLGDWVAPGGLLVLLGHDEANLSSGIGGPQDPDVLWSTGLLRATYDAAGLVVQRAEQVRRPVADEPRPALDVLLVARQP